MTIYIVRHWGIIDAAFSTIGAAREYIQHEATANMNDDQDDMADLDYWLGTYEILELPVDAKS